jgi:hypothetical protein
VIAHSEVVDAGPSFEDDPAAFVAEDERRGQLPITLADVQIRVTHTGRRDANPNFSRAGSGELDLLDRDR